MNWRRGLWRLWVVVSMIWVAANVYSDIIIETSYITWGLPINMDDDDFSDLKEAPGLPGSVTQPPAAESGRYAPITTITVQPDRTVDGDYADDPDLEAGAKAAAAQRAAAALAAKTPVNGWRLLWLLLPRFIGLPLGLLTAGMALGWTAAGFRNHSAENKRGN